MPGTVGIILKNPVITIEGTDYTGQVTQIELVPDTAKSTAKTLNPNIVLQDIDTPTWTCNVTLYQNGSLHTLLLSNDAGAEMDVVFQPEPGVGKPTVSFVMLSEPVNFGGTMGERVIASKEFLVKDQPVFGVSA